MYAIKPTAAFRATCPAFKGAAIYAQVKNSATQPDLWAEINNYITRLRTQFTTDTIKQRSGIAATRAAYKAAGKDPSRYRPACEQLARRVLQDKDLYAVDTIVDLVNLASLYGGYSTAALDADQIEGEDIELDFGQDSEPYEAIGRGQLNIAHLPVYRDKIGAFATPTSDSTRTMLRPDTHRLLVLINGYDGDSENLNNTVNYTIDLLKRYAAATDFDILHY